jgi:hypothetical protein
MVQANLILSKPLSDHQEAFHHRDFPSLIDRLLQKLSGMELPEREPIEHLRTTLGQSLVFVGSCWLGFQYRKGV